MELSFTLKNTLTHNIDDFEFSLHKLKNNLRDFTKRDREIYFLMSEFIHSNYHYRLDFQNRRNCLPYSFMMECLDTIEEHMLITWKKTMTKRQAIIYKIRLADWLHENKSILGYNTNKDPIPGEIIGLINKSFEEWKISVLSSLE